LRDIVFSHVELKENSYLAFSPLGRRRFLFSLNMRVIAARSFMTWLMRESAAAATGAF
jgi:hypothetical protein